MAALFELHEFDKLPLWAQALLAARTARRAVLWLPRNASPATRKIAIPALDAMDHCAEVGSYVSKLQPKIRKVIDWSLNADRIAENARCACYYAADATHAADSSQDFSAAEPAVTASARKAFAHAAESPGLNPIQVMTFVAADFDQLRFACKEANIQRYAPLGPAVFGRLAPVYPPDERTEESPPALRDHWS